ARGNAAPSASVIGSSSTPTVNACVAMSDPNAAAGSATCAATTSGMRVAAYQAAALEATADTQSVAASHAAGLATRRAIFAPTADPIASPPINADAIVANAYVVGPTTSASRRVQ